MFPGKIPIVSKAPLTVISNYSLDFGGTDEYVNIGDDSIFTFGDGSDDSPFSISGWIKIPDTSGADPILSKFYDITPWKGEWLFTVNSGKPILQTLDDGGSIRCRQDADSALSINVWHHVVCTYDGSSADEGIVLYVDGEVAPSTGNNNDGSYVAMNNTVAEVTIGTTLRDDGNAAYATAKIDEVAIFSRALTPAEVIQLKGSGSDLGDARDIANLVGYWRFEEGSGTSVTDLSGNGNNGTLTNMEDPGDWSTDGASS